jgi:hypothetical protein
VQSEERSDRGLGLQAEAVTQVSYLGCEGRPGDLDEAAMDDGMTVRALLVDRSRFADELDVQIVPAKRDDRSVAAGPLCEAGPVAVRPARALQEAGRSQVAQDVEVAVVGVQRGRQRTDVDRVEATERPVDRRGCPLIESTLRSGPEAERRRNATQVKQRFAHALRWHRSTELPQHRSVINARGADPAAAPVMRIVFGMAPTSAARRPFVHGPSAPAREARPIA